MNDYYVLRIVLYVANTPERFREAINAGIKVCALTRSKFVGQGLLGFVYARAGELDRANKILEELTEAAKKELSISYFVGLINTALGEKEKAIEWLEKAEQFGMGLLIILAPEPAFRSLRTEPRFIALLHKLGLK